MSDNIQDDWNEMVEQMNDAVADSMEQNMQAQAALVDAWSDAFDNSVPEEDVLEEGIEGYNRAYEVWMDAAEQMFEKTTEAAEGEDVEPTEFRDIWLQSANEAFKEVMSTSAFASANGQLVETMMEMQQEVDDVTQDTISQMGLPNREDVEEVGERIVELERRQHDVEQNLDDLADGQDTVEGQLDDLAESQNEIEQKLDRVLDAIEE